MKNGAKCLYATGSSSSFLPKDDPSHSLEQLPQHSFNPWEDDVDTLVPPASKVVLKPPSKCVRLMGVYDPTLQDVS